MDIKLIKCEVVSNDKVFSNNDACAGLHKRDTHCIIYSVSPNHELRSDKVLIIGRRDVKLEKEKKKRVISKTDEWLKLIPVLNTELNQYHYISDKSKINCLVRNQIMDKIKGYKSQDHLKTLFCSEKFIDYEFVVELLQRSDIKCFYCKRSVLLLYENVREPRQWSIERIDNKMGHNKDNVEIACLNCNLRRRTMYFERYIMTKQMKILKIV